MVEQYVHQGELTLPKYMYLMKPEKKWIKTTVNRFKDVDSSTIVIFDLAWLCHHLIGQLDYSLVRKILDLKEEMEEMSLVDI